MSGYGDDTDFNGKREQPTVRMGRFPAAFSFIGPKWSAARFLLAPMNIENGPGPEVWYIWLLSYFLEILSNMINGIFVVGAIYFSNLGTTTTSVAGRWVIPGAVSGAIWATAWLWSTDYNLKRLNNLGLALAHLFKWYGDGPTMGVLTIFLGYGTAQLLGSLLGGWFVFTYGFGVIPNPTGAAFGGIPAGNNPLAATAGYNLQSAVVAASASTSIQTGLYWLVLFFGCALWYAIIIFNEFSEQDQTNGKRDPESSLSNHKRTAVIGGLSRFVIVTILGGFGCYSLGDSSYMTGLVGVGFTAAVTSGFVYDPYTTLVTDWAHEWFTPFASAFAAGVFAFVCIALTNRARATRAVAMTGRSIEGAVDHQNGYRGAMDPQGQVAGAYNVAVKKSAAKNNRAHKLREPAK